MLGVAKARWVVGGGYTRGAMEDAKQIKPKSEKGDFPRIVELIAAV